MRKEETIKSGLAVDANELRKLILDNPEFPLLVFASMDANTGDYGWMACSTVRAEKGEFLDCQQTVNDELVFTERDEFEEALAGIMEGDSDEEFKAELEKYEPFWKPCIIVRVDN